VSPARPEGGLYGIERPTISVPEEATVAGPARRRASWNLRSIVEDVAGRPISELQDPARPVHPYLRGKIPNPESEAAPDEEDASLDMVARLYPPLVGPTGRAYHGSQHEHHEETLARHRTLTDASGRPVHPPGPSSRPERLYLHYLLLHMDRLSPSALRYLRAAVDEELDHRAARSGGERVATERAEPSLSSAPSS
jgi:hypothetical protein